MSVTAQLDVLCRSPSVLIRTTVDQSAAAAAKHLLLEKATAAAALLSVLLLWNVSALCGAYQMLHGSARSFKNRAVFRLLVPTFEELWGLIDSSAESENQG